MKCDRALVIYLLSFYHCPVTGFPCLRNDMVHPFCQLHGKDEDFFPCFTGGSRSGHAAFVSGRPTAIKR